MHSGTQHSIANDSIVACASFTTTAEDTEKLMVLWHAYSGKKAQCYI